MFISNACTGHRQHLLDRAGLAYNQQVQLNGGDVQSNFLASLDSDFCSYAIQAYNNEVINSPLAAAGLFCLQNTEQTQYIYNNM